MSYKSASLSPESLQIIRHKGTETPADKEDSARLGTYLCRQCGIALYRSTAKFNSGCGWPSFDEEIPTRIKHSPDADGKRIEILCFRCDAHLGHVFTGEYMTPKNIRHCVNAISMDFVADTMVDDTQEAIYAAGCFWGVEYYMQRLPGVLKTEVGYTGGTTLKPSYNQICLGGTGHVEAIRVIFDPTKTSYEYLTKFFFEIHDPSQQDGQGPDRGPQYLSRIFYYDDTQKAIALEILAQLEKLTGKVATEILPVTVFWRAEDDHQDYYTVQNKLPYCHQHIKKF